MRQSNGWVWVITALFAAACGDSSETEGAPSSAGAAGSTNPASTMMGNIGPGPAGMNATPSGGATAAGGSNATDGPGVDATNTTGGADGMDQTPQPSNGEDCPDAAPDDGDMCDSGGFAQCAYGDASCFCFGGEWQCVDGMAAQPQDDTVPQVNEDGTVTNPEACPDAAPEGACEGQLACAYDMDVCVCGFGDEWACFGAGDFMMGGGPGGGAAD